VSYFLAVKYTVTMPPRRTRKAGMGRKRRRGGNVLKKIANGIKKGVSVLKKTRLISRIAAPIGAALGAPEMGAQIAGTAGKLGFGRRRRRRGGNSTVKNIVSGIKRGINTLKKTRLVSRIAVPVGEALGHPNAGKSVAQTPENLDLVGAVEEEGRFLILIHLSALDLVEFV
jgi:hypothetical protein